MVNEIARNQNCNGHMNAKIGEGKKDANIVGPFGLGNRNNRGDMCRRVVYSKQSSRY